MAMKQQIASDNASLLQIRLGNQSLLDSNNREFQRQLASIDVNYAVQMAQQNMAFAAQQGQIQALGQAATTGIGVAGKLDERAQQRQRLQSQQALAAQTAQPTFVGPPSAARGK